MDPSGYHIIAEFLDCSATLNNQKTKKILSDGIKKSGLGLVDIYSHNYTPVGLTVVAVLRESHAVIHTYPESRHASIDIFTCSPSEQKPLKLLGILKSGLRPKKTRIMQLRRGSSIENIDSITGFSFKGIEIKYGVKKKLLSKRSKYQKIDIIENPVFGRMLFLDNDLQIAETDADLYNKALTEPLPDPLNKTAILGGGDGGVLQEILKKNPKKCYLVDMDREVIDSSKKFLKSICRNAFESNARIVIDDASKFLENNKGFDAIISDLTWNPNDKNKEKIFGDFIRKIHKSLASGGILTMQCCPEIDRETFVIARKMLKKYFRSVEFKKVFIPSYCVNWIFATARK